MQLLKGCDSHDPSRNLGWNGGIGQLKRNLDRCCGRLGPMSMGTGGGLSGPPSIIPMDLHPPLNNVSMAKWLPAVVSSNQNPTRTANSSAQLFPGNFSAVLCQSCQHSVADVEKSNDHECFPLSTSPKLVSSNISVGAPVSCCIAQRGGSLVGFTAKVFTSSILCVHTSVIYMQNTLVCKIIAKDFQKTKS